MFRKMLAAAGFVLVFAHTAFAEDAMKPMMKCDEASMMKVQGEMDAMAGDSMKMQKDEAMKHMDMAKDAMKANKADECAMHLEEASKSMMKKM